MKPVSEDIDDKSCTIKLTLLDSGLDLEVGSALELQAVLAKLGKAAESGTESLESAMLEVAVEYL